MAGGYSVPHYKVKGPRISYLQKGEPWDLDEDYVREHLPTIYDLTKEEMGLWDDSKNAVLNKNKKKEFQITFDPPRLHGQKHIYKIEILHKDYQGFVYTAAGYDEKEVKEKFWPIVQKLMAKYCGPRMLRPNNPYQNN